MPNGPRQFYFECHLHILAGPIERIVEGFDNNAVAVLVLNGNSEGSRTSISSHGGYISEEYTLRSTFTNHTCDSRARRFEVTHDEVCHSWSNLMDANVT